MTLTQAEMQAAIDAINERCGLDIRAPWECSLDDRELEQFNGLCAAVAAAKRVAAQVAATNAKLASEDTSEPPKAWIDAKKEIDAGWPDGER